MPDDEPDEQRGGTIAIHDDLARLLSELANAVKPLTVQLWRPASRDDSGDDSPLLAFVIPPDLALIRETRRCHKRETIILQTKNA